MGHLQDVMEVKKKSPFFLFLFFFFNIVLLLNQGGPLGHPAVYVELEDGKVSVCGYCGLRYEKDDHHH